MIEKLYVRIDETYTLGAEQVIAIEKFISDYATFPPKKIGYEIVNNI